MDRHIEDREDHGNGAVPPFDAKPVTCCAPRHIPGWLGTILGQLHDDVTHDGTGLTVLDDLLPPMAIEGTSVLDLNCGVGRNAYVLSAMTGEGGRVVGLDPSSDALSIARRHQEFHRVAFGHTRTNTTFHEGSPNTLTMLDLIAGSFDLVVSNGALSGCTDCSRALRDVFDLLQTGGELFVSDIFADRRLPAHLMEDEMVRKTGLSGALYWNDVLKMAKDAGFAEPRLVARCPLTLRDTVVQDRLSPIRFARATYRFFKLENPEPSCEDYGLAVIYNGTIDHSPACYRLDAQNLMETGKVVPVSGTTWRMLAESRLAEHFDFLGNFATHFGAFTETPDCAPFSQG